MWECYTCNKRFEKPIAAYGVNDESGECIDIIREEDENFSVWDFMNSDKVFYCPFCGSDLTTDLNEP